MNQGRYKNIFCTAAIILFVIAASAKIKADIIPHIYSENVVNICDSLSKKRVLFFVVIDKINRSDSLYGYNLKIKYDTTKLVINNYVEGNTLSEFFDKSFSYGLNGLISGYGISHWVIGPPSFGDSLLIGFSAEWLGNCPDSTYLSIEELEFTSEFKRNYDSLGGGYVKALKAPKDKSIECNFDSSDYNISKIDTNVNILITLNVPDYHNINNLNIVFNMMDTLKLIEAEVETSNANLVSIDSKNNKILINKIANGQNYIIIKSKFKIIDYNTLKNSYLKIANLEMDECSCILNYKTDSVRFYQDTLSIDEIENEIVVNSDYIQIVNPGNFENIEVYDYLGNLIRNIKLDKPETKIILREYSRGLYFFIIKNNKNEIKKIYKYYSN
ncbi:MAG TPA: hypothetical protein PLC04_03545 [Candidatus Kapabacteria bacterium]|nr:hypothetical protein [Candidatus Kapabacteria bacterium]HOV92137.1 hypothetical protein [Candidatus Kapabacteria bacterium]